MLKRSTLIRKLRNEVGSNAAEIFDFLHGWIKFNQKNNEKSVFKDNKYWTHIKQKSIAEELMLSEYQVMYAVKKLVDSQYIEKNNFNSSKWDKENWYTLGSKGIELAREDEAADPVPEECIQSVTIIETPLMKDEYINLSGTRNGRISKKVYNELCSSTSPEFVAEALERFAAWVEKLDGANNNNIKDYDKVFSNTVMKDFRKSKSASKPNYAKSDSRSSDTGSTEYDFLDLDPFPKYTDSDGKKHYIALDDIGEYYYSNDNEKVYIKKPVGMYKHENGNEYHVFKNSENKTYIWTDFTMGKSEYVAI